MNIPYDNYSPNQNPAGNTNSKKKKSKKGLLIAILVLLVLTFIVNSLILADAIHTKYVTYQALGSFVATDKEAEKKASTQGNLGNYNIISKKNSLSDNKDDTYTLTLELEFVNYSGVGRSFNEAVELTAYQNDKEIEADELKDRGEANVKVRNGQTANVILTYILTDRQLDVNLDMISGNNEFTYTVKLSQPKSQQTEEQTTAEETKE